MKLLLDTHIWLWGMPEPHKLSEKVSQELTDTANELWLSPISPWETLGSLPEGAIRLGGRRLPGLPKR